MPGPGSIFPKAAYFAVALLAAVPAAGGAEKTFANYPRLFLDTRATFAYAQLYMDDQITTEHGYLGEAELNGNANVLFLKPGHLIRASSLYLGLGYALTRPYRDQPIDQSLRLSAGIDLNRFFNAYLSQSIGAPESQGALGVSIKMFESHFADGFIGARIMETKYAMGSEVDVLERLDFGVSMILRLHNGLRKDSVYIRERVVRASDIRRILPAQKDREEIGGNSGDGGYYAITIGGFLLFATMYMVMVIGKSMRGS
jgi:hypothetical protein